MVTEADREAEKAAQYFFEIGFMAAWAEGAVRYERAPFPLSDHIIDKAWATARDGVDDPAEWDAHLARHRTASTAALTAEIQRLRKLLAMPRMFDAFRTTTLSGSDPRYVMTFKFRTMQAMHDADSEWIAFRKEAQEYFGLPASWAEQPALSTPSEVSEPVADESGGEGERKPRSWYIGQAATPPNPTDDAVREALEQVCRIVDAYPAAHDEDRVHEDDELSFANLRALATLAKHGGAEG